MVKKIVIACDSFKGCLSSEKVAEAVSEGVEKIFPECERVLLAVADGGEGTNQILTKALGGEHVKVAVSDPLGRSVTADYGIIEDKDHCRTAIIEMAQASGLTLLSKNERNPLLTSTYGTGEMILDALNRGCRKFIIGIGGSATNDGGTGMLEALGFRFIDERGKEIKGCCGDRLADIADIDDKNVRMEIHESEFVVACDVNAPFCGSEGAARVFAEQKGADTTAIETLEAGMQNLASVIYDKYCIDLSKTPGAGAAGGLGGAFKTFLNAELKSGIDTILDIVGFDERISNADIVITGEGKIDFQSGKGKVIDGIFRRCSARNIPVLAIAGIVDWSESEEKPENLIAVLPIGPRPQNESDLKNAMRPEVAYRNISDTVTKVLKELSPSLCRGNL